MELQICHLFAKIKNLFFSEAYAKKVERLCRYVILSFEN